MPAYYLIDDREKVIIPATPEMLDDRRRIESSTRRFVPAYSSEVQRYLRMGYKLKNPYVGFRKLSRQLARKGVDDPKALAAWIGRRKYGHEQFQRMAAEGRRAQNPGRYMLTFHDGRGEFIEAWFSPSLEDLAKKTSRQDDPEVRKWVLWRHGKPLSSGKFSRSSDWMAALRSGKVTWLPKKFRGFDA